MKLLFLYGPPAVGKLTVAKELAEMTGFKIFHNHLTIDVIESIFSKGSQVTRELVRKYRLMLMEDAAKEGIQGMIFTYVYCHTPSNDAFIQAIITLLERHNSEIHFVRLYCDEDALKERVVHGSRGGYGKIQTVSALEAFMKEQDLSCEVPHGKSLAIETMKLSPKEAAYQIKTHFRL